MMHSKLPSFSSLLAFDAAARHNSFTKAANDLNVSQPAISRRVSLLEDDLGVKLFDRSTKPMTITPTGDELFDILSSGLSRLEAKVDDIRSRSSNRKFTIIAFPGFLSYWLIPRLPYLRASFPDIDLRIITSDDKMTVSQGDIFVRFGDGRWPDLLSKKITGEEVYAVCSPGFIGDRKIPLKIEELAEERLLQMSENKGRWYDWSTWFDKIGYKGPDLQHTTEIDSYATIVSAAIAGEGISLCWAGLLDPLVERGALVRVSEEVAISENGYFATYKKGTDNEKLTQEVVAWLCNA